MPRNGSGVYSSPSDTWNPAVPGTVIESGATGWEDQRADIAAALTQSLSRDGQTVWTGNQNAGGSFKITNMADGSAATDSATVGQIAASGGSFVSAGGVTGTADAILLAPSPAITAYAAGQEFWWVSEGTNTTAVTVAVSGLAAKAVQWDSSAITAGTIVLAHLVGIKYDGTAFQLLPFTGLIPSTDAGAALGPQLILDRGSASPAASDLLGAETFLGRDSGGNATTYAQIVARIDDATDTTEDGSLVIRTMVAGTLTDMIAFGAGGISYATGTFTPVLTFGVGGVTGIAYVLQQGRYTKIGSLVTFSIDIQLSSKGSSTGVASITGLPFTALATPAQGVVPVGGNGTTFALTAASAGLVGYIAGSGTTIVLGQQTVSGSASISDTNFSNTSTFQITGSYFA